MQSGQKKLHQLFGIDLRSLALFRVALALHIIIDLINRASDLKAHYTDWGLLPRGALLTQFWRPWYFSLHLLNGQAAFQAVLFLLAGAAALGLLVGYRTRLAAMLSWLLLVSLHARNPVILQGGDTLLRMLLFWSTFLPLGAKYSVDQALTDSPKPHPKAVFSIGSFALLLQVAMVYFFSFLLKDHPIWHNGEAIYYALNIDQFATPLGHELLKYPGIMKGLTYGVLYLECFGPMLAFVPFWNATFRIAAILLFWSFHAGLAVTMELGMFPYIGMIAWLPFLPGMAWDKLFSFLRHRDRTKVTIYYDSTCDFCKKATLIFRTFFLLSQARVCPAHDVASDHAKMTRNQHWLVEDHSGHCHSGFDGWLHCCRISPILGLAYPLLKQGMVRQIGDRIIAMISSKRSGLSQLTAFLKFRKPARLSSRTGQLLALICLIYVVLWNLRTLDYEKYEVFLAASTDSFGQLLHINQKWNMFTPHPLRNDGWYVIEGKLESGKKIDLWRDGMPVNWQKPKLVSAMYKNQRWRKYMMNLRKKRFKRHRRHFGRYLCRKWNSRPGEEKVTRIKIYYIRERTLPNYKLSAVKKKRLWTCRCFKK